MKPWILILFSLTLLITSDLFAQEAEGTGEGEDEGPGRRGRLVDFNILGDVDPLQQYLATPNWFARLNSSADYTRNRKLTYTRNAQNVDGDKNFLGVRANFPDFSNNAYVTISPPLAFPFYGTVESGIITNVGSIKSVIARVAGRNYPYSFSLNIERNDGEVIHAPLGRIEYLGWRDLEYNNQEYIEDLQDRTLLIRPAYPRIIPSARIKDLAFFRNGETTVHGDFVSYVAWVDIVYDNIFSEQELQELRESEDYVDDDALWGIQSDEIGVLEAKIFQDSVDRYRYLEQLERDKMNLPPLDIPPAGSLPTEAPGGTEAEVAPAQ